MPSAWRGVPLLSDIIFERATNLPILETRGCGIVLDNAKLVKLFPDRDESFCVCCFSHGCNVFKGVWVQDGVVRRLLSINNLTQEAQSQDLVSVSAANL
jgi:hypothetical protein